MQRPSRAQRAAGRPRPSTETGTPDVDFHLRSRYGYRNVLNKHLCILFQYSCLQTTAPPAEDLRATRVEVLHEAVKIAPGGLRDKQDFGEESLLYTFPLLDVCDHVHPK